MSDTLRLMGSPVKSQRKVAERISGLVEREFSVGLCVPRFCGKLESNRAVKFSKTTMRHSKKSGKKGSTAGSHANMCTSGAHSVGSKIWRKERKTKPCNRSGAPAETHGIWQRMSCNSQRKKDTFYSPAEAWVMPAPSSTNPEFVFDSRASMHTLSKKDLGSGELETLRRSKNLMAVVTANGEGQTNEEARENVHNLHLFVTVQLLEYTPAVLS